MRWSINRFHPTLLTLALLVSPGASAAQLAKWFEIGFPVVAPEQARIDFLLLGFRVGSIQPLVLGVDFSTVTLPVALTKGVLVIGSGLDLTFPIPVSRWATLTPRLGGTALVAGAREFVRFGVITGYNAGIGLVARTAPTTLLRLDITRHWLEDNLDVSIVTIGFQMH